MADASSPPADLNGKWQLVRNDNFDAYLKSVDIGLIKRKMINSMTPVVEMEQNGDDFKVTAKIPVAGPIVSTFKVGVEFTDSNPMMGGRDEKRVLAEWRGCKLVHTVVSAPKDKPMSIEREIVDGELVITMTNGDVVAKRYFKKLPSQ
ncbi:fatty acid-binding protein, heart-like [Asterias amurensis]|uniref:fatty acid-binding protein, heart-like n=1 Tax=Asterias amurensis TaxID=7602 RepID=UPI003AB781EB